VELLSDFRRHVSAAYGVLLEEKFYAKRAYFLVDVHGIVRWEHVEAQTRDKRENAELLTAIAALGAATARPATARGA
jgi:alkyl hydroperoxide reductase subunit AhpC